MDKPRRLGQNGRWSGMTEELRRQVPWNLPRKAANYNETPDWRRGDRRSVARILLLNGPNLGLLGTREPVRYGRRTLGEIVADARQLAGSLGHELSDFQSDAEHELVARIHRAGAEQVACIVINPGALAHTSVALRDALLAVGIRFIEVHVSNVHAREPFRRVSYLADAANGVISGLGPLGYLLAIRAAAAQLDATG
jgi:3-dehydroquinate dehydratase-2